MNTCDTCKWWHTQDGGPRPLQSLCNNPLVGGGVADNDLRGAFGGTRLNVNPPNAQVPIFTGAKFGCIHHAQKSTPTCRICGSEARKGIFITPAILSDGEQSMEGTWIDLVPITICWKCQKCGHSFTL